MRDLLYLSSRHALHHRVRTAILILCLAVAAYLPSIVQILTVRYETSLNARAQSTPLIMGAKGNRFDLTLSALYFRSSKTDPVPYAEFETLANARAGLAIPLNLRFTAQTVPIVCTSIEYFDARSLTLDSGNKPLRVGDIVLGSAVASVLNKSVGETIQSDQPQAFDIAEAPAITLRIVGVLKPTGTPDDEAIFAEIRTAWMLEGAMHGHDKATEVDPRMVFAETDDGVVLNSAVRQLNQITAENAASFHVHGEEGDLPLSAILLFPSSNKDATIVKARINNSRLYQMLIPSDVIDDLMGFVFRIKGFLDLVAVLLAICVGLMTLLVILLTMKLRAREMLTLNHIGCGRFTTIGLYSTELAMILIASAILAALSVWLSLALLPNLVTAI